MEKKKKENKIEFENVEGKKHSVNDEWMCFGKQNKENCWFV